MDDIGVYIDAAFFTWKKTDRGYCLDDSPETKTNFNDILLIENPESTSRMEYYPTDENPALFLDFADLEPTKENILQFVNQYGLLTESFFDDYKDTQNWLKPADSLSFFRSEVWEMKFAVFLWEALKNPNIDELAKNIHWQVNENNEIVEIKYLYVHQDNAGISKKGFTISPKTNPQIFQRFVLNKPILPTRVILQRVINEQLKKHRIYPRLLLDEFNGLQPYMHPTSLLAAMWYQLYQAIATNRKYKRCAYCNKWNDITEKAHNWRACPGCSNRARAKRSYLKKKEDDKNARKNTETR